MTYPRKPLCIDLFCGLGGWAEGLLSEGWEVIGFDIERHCYAAPSVDTEAVNRPGMSWSGSDDPNYKGVAFNRPIAAIGTPMLHKYPAQLVLQDVLTLHGSQFKDAACIVASPPCQEYSYMAMPWSRAKQIAGALRGECGFPEGYTGSTTVEQLNALFNACFRIQREASEAAGHHIPLIVENVKGAQPWVGKAQANYGSYYLWGDVESVGGRIVGRVPLRFGMPAVKAARRIKQPGRNFHFPEKYGIPSPSFHGAEHETSVPAALALKTVGHANQRDGHTHARHLTNQRESDAIKQHGSGPEWFDNGIASHSSRSDSRKAASALIAKIPFDLSQHIARVFKPSTPSAVNPRLLSSAQNL